MLFISELFSLKLAGNAIVFGGCSLHFVADPSMLTGRIGSRNNIICSIVLGDSVTRT
jgi:hypothetical protein